mmetsp:Transcript_5273/g.18386  ORF Transcript_5273/g.18386 Transcript_5273/m.18386 type:complete len:312 (-) Transcript_5273:133-1068(-)
MRCDPEMPVRRVGVEAAHGVEELPLREARHAPAEQLAHALDFGLVDVAADGGGRAGVAGLRAVDRHLDATGRAGLVLEAVKMDRLAASLVVASEVPDVDGQLQKGLERVSAVICRFARTKPEEDAAFYCEAYSLRHIPAKEVRRPRSRGEHKLSSLEFLTFVGKDAHCPFWRRFPRSDGSVKAEARTSHGCLSAVLTHARLRYEMTRPSLKDANLVLGGGEGWETGPDFGRIENLVLERVLNARRERPGDDFAVRLAHHEPPRHREQRLLLLRGRGELLPQLEGALQERNIRRVLEVREADDARTTMARAV